MEAVIDPDVKAVVEFMQGKIETRKLVGVAENLRAMAPILWGHYDSVRVTGIALEPDLIRKSGTLSAANELSLGRMCVGDGFAGEEATHKQMQPLSHIPHSDKFPSTE
jgi:hypothetical protein